MRQALIGSSGHKSAPDHKQERGGKDMSYEIKKAAVLGAGVMGATIAAHLTNAGIPCCLLDIIPFELTEADKKQGLTEKSPAWRNRFAANGLAGVTKSKPASFYSKKNASMVKIGNFEDNLNWLADVDWVIEVVIENLKIKQELFAKVEKIVKPTCIVTTNTSGLPIKDITAKSGAKFKEHFLGTHFFNPPRYMKLLEIIPGEKTSKEIVDYMITFCEQVLGKGVVVCKDVPNFIGNRIGVFDISNAINLMVEKKMKIEEVDAVIGKALGRPGTAVFGTLDLVGLDTGHHVMTNLHEAVPDDERRDVFVPKAKRSSWFWITMPWTMWLQQSRNSTPSPRQRKRPMMGLPLRLKRSFSGKTPLRNWPGNTSAITSSMRPTVSRRFARPSWASITP
jgi:3-hydroxyacyl-CoA dehydrogenase